jgi:subtilisin-like proprotein convertase family protein
MRLKKHVLWLGLLLLAAGGLFWKASTDRARREVAGQSETAARSSTAQSQQASAPDILRAMYTAVATNPPNAVQTNPFAFRLTNTTETLAKLLRNDRAILLRNALIDTTRELPEIPAHLRAEGEHGSYIVQARPITQPFRDWLIASGAEIISYIPNNSFLVRASSQLAETIRANPDTHAVLTYEPYYKLDSHLLAVAVRQEPSPYPELNVVTFPGHAEEVSEELSKLGARVRPLDRTRLGEIITAAVPAYSVPEVARLSKVQLVAVAFPKSPVNDLSRVMLRVSRGDTNPSPTISPASTTHYGAPRTNDFLTGAGVLVGITDTGVDVSHEDFAGRVTGPGAGTDFDGHGTHVAGSLLGDGKKSPLVAPKRAAGSSQDANFYGIAPAAQAYVQSLYETDSVLQENTALQKVLISNNSWGFPAINDYDIFAASYDAAVRDSLPGVMGEQEVLYVFAAGNQGRGGPDGMNGFAGSIISPATAKNVITVGAADQFRRITNIVTLTRTNGETVQTQPWLGMTDSDDQVAPFSSRGNVGIGIEGVSGRIKPDVVAPGAMVVSTRSAQFTDPDGATNTVAYVYNAVPLPYRATNLFALQIPNNAVSVLVTNVPNQQSPTNPFPALLMGAAMDAFPTGVIGTNGFVLTAPTLREGTLFYTIANPFYPDTVIFDLLVVLTLTNDVGDYYQVLKQLNDALGPDYRFESGTSMAAPKVSGMLALMQQYLTNNFSLRPSPALLKALLINGSRSLSENYNLDSQAVVNHQGWGIPSMSNSVPIGMQNSVSNGPLRFFEQNITNGLATGDTHVYEVNVPARARSHPLRMTLVWTDPPGNPAASTKLVNDLNLTVVGESANASAARTNSLLWVGNNFPSGSDFSAPFVLASTDTDVETNSIEQVESSRDAVNNVENVYIPPPLATSYRVIVKGHRVNVNALNSHSNNIAQDYALVISSGNVSATNVNLGITLTTLTNDPTPRVTGLNRATNANSAGLLNQRVGANSPLIVSTNGATNQWAFFTYTNVPTANFTHVAIFTFLPPELSRPRLWEADIDLYVARDVAGTNLINLDPDAVGASSKALTRGGTEVVIFSNAQPNEVFTIGVKSEDQQGAQFNIFAVSSDRPFSSRDESNNIVAVALNLPVVIPDGTPDNPGATNVFALVVEPPDVKVGRVWVTNNICHGLAGDLVASVTHQDATEGRNGFVVLKNHTTNACRLEIYDDSEQGDLGTPTSNPPVIPPDGPGTLRDFMGHSAFGLWNMTVVDNAKFHTGAVQELTFVIEPASTNAEDAVNTVLNLAPGRWGYRGFIVPADATNIEACVTYIDGSGPIELYLRRDALPTRTDFDKGLTDIATPGACLNLGVNDTPPINPGRYYVGVYNAGTANVRVHLRVRVQRGLQPNRELTVPNDNAISFIDDATTNSVITVTNRGIVTGVEVDVRLEHPRISDLALHLVSPQGFRVLLAENRGRDTTNGYGWSANEVVTNFGARVLDSSFEGTVTAEIPSPAQYGGWTVESGDIEVLHPAAERALNAHTGTNIIDINGTVPGRIWTNVTLVPGRTYLLSFAYTRNPDSGPATAEVLVSNEPPMTVVSPVATPWENLRWITTSMVFRATSIVTRLEVRAVSWPQPQTGVLFDTFRIDEVEISTNRHLYATFTDDASKALQPLKFALPPFGETNFNGTNILVSGFENPNGPDFSGYTNANTFTKGQPFAGWLVTSNSIYIQTNNVLAYSDTNFVFLRTGVVSRSLHTQIGKEYVLEFATRTARRMIYSTGVDQDDVTLGFGELDSHYFVPTNIPSGSTNRTWVLQPGAIGATWIDRTNGHSRWIGIDPLDPVPGTPAGQPTYYYRTDFDLTGYDLSKPMTLIGKATADTRILSTWLNGNDVSFAQPDPSSYGVFIITSGFKTGRNRLQFVVENSPAAASQHGFRAEFAPNAFTGSLMTNRTPRTYMSVGRVKLEGAYTNFFTAFSDLWRVERVRFVARATNTVLEFAGVTPGVWLDQIQMRETGRKYYFPEEPLTPLIGQPTLGDWKLEIWDSRLGAPSTGNELISWRINLAYLRTNPPITRLANDVTVQARLGTNSMRYFFFDVPCDYGTVTNSLYVTNSALPVDLIFNQFNIPVTGQFGDYPLMVNVTNDVQYLEVGSAPLLTSGRYFLAVRNRNNAPVDVVLRVGMDTNCTESALKTLRITAPSSKNISNGFFTLTWKSDPGAVFRIESASDPAGPWTELAGAITSESEDFSFTDTTARVADVPHRFYRLRRLP